MTQDQINLLKSQLPISFNITMSMDYPNGMVADNITFRRPDNSIGNMNITPEYSTFARVTGTIGMYGVVLTWNYKDGDDIKIDYSSPLDGGENKISILQLKEFLLKLKG